MYICDVLMETRDYLCIFFLRSCLSCFLRHDLSLAWASLFQHSLLTRESQVSTCLCFPRARIASKCFLSHCLKYLLVLWSLQCIQHTQRIISGRATVFALLCSEHIHGTVLVSESTHSDNWCLMPRQHHVFQPWQPQRNQLQLLMALSSPCLHSATVKKPCNSSEQKTYNSSFFPTSSWKRCFSHSLAAYFLRKTKDFHTSFSLHQEMLFHFPDISLSKCNLRHYFISFQSKTLKEISYDSG